VLLQYLLLPGQHFCLALHPPNEHIESMSILQSIWRYREFIFLSIISELKLRFSRSTLGGLWIVIHPLVQVIIYATIFSAVLSAKLPDTDNKFAYTAYLISGMLGWTIFSEVFTRCVNVFIDNGNLIKKMSFPKLCLPLIVAGVACVNGAILTVAIIIVLAILSYSIGLALFVLPVLIFITVFFGLSLGLLLGILNVFIRDIGQIVSIVMQLLFWFTPIVYPISIIPSQFHIFLKLNPIYHFVTAYQSVLVYNQAPQITSLVLLLALSFLLLWCCFITFRKAAPDMADQL